MKIESNGTSISTKIFTTNNECDLLKSLDFQINKDKIFIDAKINFYPSEINLQTVADIQRYVWDKKNKNFILSDIKQTKIEIISNGIGTQNFKILDIETGEFISNIVFVYFHVDASNIDSFAIVKWNDVSTIGE